MVRSCGEPHGTDITHPIVSWRGLEAPGLNDLAKELARARLDRVPENLLGRSLFEETPLFEEDHQV